MTVANGHVTVQSHRLLGNLLPGKAETGEFALPPLGTASTGIVAQLSAGAGFVQSQFLAAQLHSGVVVTAGSYQQLPDAALASDLARRRITRQAFERAEARRHQVPGFSRATIRVRRQAGSPPPATPRTATPAPAASSTAIVSGQITYRDLNGTQRPMRNVLVGISSDGGATRITSARTDRAGDYTLTFTPANCSIGVGYQIQAVTDVGVGTVLGSSGSAYSELSGPITPCAGDVVSGVNLDIPHSNDAGKAFALSDALYTVGSYYASIRQSGWDTALTVHYPDGTNSEYTDRSSHNIFVDGGSTSCGGSACPEEAFDWDSLAHESGHAVAFQGGFDASPGGAHNVCDNAWTGSRSKTDAVHLAWSEGWATFYGLNALQEAGVPNGIPGVQYGVYNDNDPNNVNNFSYALDDDSSSYCTPSPSGEDSELAVQRALWEFHDNDYDSYGGSIQWPMSYILSRLESAQPTTFTAAYNALASGQSSSILLDSQRTLGALGFAPAPSVGSGSPPAISWQAGGSSGHPNNSFTVSFINNSNGSPVYQTSTTATSYTPSAAVWQTISQYSSVSVQITGTQTTSPQSGPFTGALVPVTTVSGHIPRILIVGDSISNGLEGAYTWRFRLWQHFAGSNVPVQFVGHRTGTENIYDDPNSLALVNGTPSPGAAGYDQNPTDGSYRDDSFQIAGQSNHDAVWGWQLHLAMSEIQNEVATYQPDYLLVELGFNDIAFGINSPSGAIADMGTLIANARAANPNLKIAVANIIHRTELAAYPNINPNITSFNNALPAAIASWSTSKSPVTEADISSNYDPSTDSFDGLHPNGVGEYILAAGFETALHNAFGLGPAADPIPSSVPDLSMSAPPWTTATAEAQGILIQWGHTYGASGYYLYSEDVTAGATSFTRLPLPIPGDHWTDRWVQAGHTYAYYVTAVRGNSSESAASPTAQAAANPGTLTGPQDITDTPGANSIAVSWNAVPGDNGSYQVLWSDQSLGAPNFGNATITGTSYTITGLTPGHVYAVAVVAINQYGGGYPGGAMPALVGAGTPSPTPVMKVGQQIDATDALLEWTHPINETGAWIYQSTDSGATFSKLPFPVVPATDLANGNDQWVAGLLFQPINTYAYYVVSCNGSDCTAHSNTMTITPLGAAAARQARMTTALRNEMATMIDPSRQYYKEGLGQTPPGPEPAP